MLGGKAPGESAAAGGSADAKETTSLTLPILEGRKITLQQITDPTTQDFVDVDYSFSGEPSLGATTTVHYQNHTVTFPNPLLPPPNAPPGQIINDPLLSNATSVYGTSPFPYLLTYVCAYEIAADSEIVPAGYADLDVTPPATPALFPNPGTPVQSITTVNGTEYNRYMPGYLGAATYLSTTSLLSDNTCDAGAYWKQEMELCMARHYMDLAEAVGPYIVSYRAVQTPCSKVPVTDSAYNRCNVNTARAGLSEDIGLVLEPEASHEDHKAELKRVATEMLQRGILAVDCSQLNRRGCIPVLNLLAPYGVSLDPTQSIDQLAESVANVWNTPGTRFPVQSPEDVATLTLLALNYYHEANRTGLAIIGCQQSTNDTTKMWLDRYDHHALSVAQMVVTNVVDGMREMIEAGDLAQDQIVAAADRRTQREASAEAWQQRWRGRINSRLEALHAWTHLAPELFETDGTASADPAALYPVYPWLQTNADVELARSMMRQYGVDPRLASAGLTTFQQVLWAASNAGMPKTTTGLHFDTLAPAAGLMKLGLNNDALQTAASVEIDVAGALGWAIASKTGTNGVLANEMITVPGGMNYPKVVGPATQRAEASVPYLYARSAGGGYNDFYPPDTPNYSFNGVAGSLAASETRLTQLASNLKVSLSSGTRPFFPAPTTVPANMIADDSSERDHVGLLTSGLQLAASEVPEAFTFCPSGPFHFTATSFVRSSGNFEVWRGDKGYECAMYGKIGDAPCDESAFKIPFATNPVPAWTISQGVRTWSGVLTNLSTIFPPSGVIPAGERIYVTVTNANNQREIFGAVTVTQYKPEWLGVRSPCIFGPGGIRMFERVRTLLSPNADHPAKPKICCDNLPCDLAVPLEDSLQSTPPREVESSYMHYLSLARSAADRADQLGEEIYRQGLEMDQRAEAARDELETICGGVVNVDRLGPQPCTSTPQCCDPAIPVAQCSASCQDPDGDGKSFCSGESVGQALKVSQGARCQQNSDCTGTNALCATSGDLRWCTTSCSGSGQSTCAAGQLCFNNTCFQNCTTTPNGCAEGFTCEPAPDGVASICNPLVEADLGAIEQCLGTGTDKVIAVAVGKKPLVAWQQGKLGLCACNTVAGETCPNPFDADTGIPICPVVNDPLQPVTLPPNFTSTSRQRVDITTTLGFSVDPAPDQVTTFPACMALARLRANIRKQTVTAQDDVNTVMQQPFMTLEGFQNLVSGHDDSVLDYQFDTFGFLQITRGGSTWLTTGSAANGPLPTTNTAWPQGRLLVPAPVDPASNLAVDPDPCTGNPGAGQPLGCATLGSGLNANRLARAVQLIRLFSGGRRIPIGNFISFSGQVTEPFTGNQIPSLMPSTDRFPLPNWLQTLAGNASGQIRGVARTYGSGLWNNDDDSDVKDDSGNIPFLQCMEGVATYAAGTPGMPTCPPTTGNPAYYPSLFLPFDGHVLSEMFRKDTGPSGGARDNNEKEARSLFDTRAGGNNWKNLLDQLANNYAGVPANGAGSVLTGFRIPNVDAYWNGESERPTPSTRKPITNGEALDALELGCMIAAIPGGAQKGSGLDCPTDPQPLSVTGPQDFPKLADRLRCTASQFEHQLERMWLPQIPASVATAIAKGQVTGTFPILAGDYNVTVQDMQGALLSFISGTRTVATTLRQFATDLESSRGALEKISNQSDILTWQLLADVSNAATGCATGFGIDSAAKCVNAAVQIVSASAIESINQKNLKIDEKQALRDLSTVFSDRMDTISGAADQMNEAYTTLQGLVSKLDVQRSAAERAAAKVLFLDRDSTGRVYNVNTAMRRRMSTLKARYDVALKDAKKMAFIARRSIEQRLAVDLESFDQDMLLVEKPKNWANDACSMTGIDYDRIRDSGSSPVANTKSDNFSSGYIGDYVTKLENFVESYRFQYPFTDGSDVAVVSLRDDLKRVTAPCQVEGPNLLYNSADLLAPPDDGIPGWENRSDTGSTVTLTATGHSPNANGLGGEPSGKGSGVAMQLTAGIQTSGAIGAFWGQEVDLDAGIYMVSWYEWAPNVATAGVFDRCNSSAAPGTNNGQLVVRATGLDAPTQVTLTPIAGRITGEPFIGDCFVRFSARLDVTLGQKVLLRFGTTSATVRPIWAQPQLELVDTSKLVASGGSFTIPTTVVPRAFFPTSSTLTFESGDCEDTNGDVFRTMWESGQSKCDPICPDGTGSSCDQFATTSTLGQQCYHEIHFSVAGSQVERGAFGAQIARSNFNYRYSRMAVNLVGSDLRSCGEALYSSSCNAAGYVQYSLFQDPPYTVTNHAKDLVDVNLFPARIVHAKALAAERVLTNPLSSADRALMEDYWREEFRGRPLQGNYTLRLYDQIGQDGGAVMAFDRLEDVQMVFDYNYWTRSGD